VNLELKDIASDATRLDPALRLASLSWSSQGHVLAASADNGAIYGLLGSVPAVCAVHGSRAVHLTSLTQASIMDFMDTELSGHVCHLIHAPQMMALGPKCLLTCANNTVASQSFETQQTKALSLPSGSVQAMIANAAIAAFLVNSSMSVFDVQTLKQLASPCGQMSVTCIALTDCFLIVGTAGGHVQHYSAEDTALSPLNDFCHIQASKPVGIVSIWAATGAAHMVFMDAQRGAHLFTPVNDQVRRTTTITRFNRLDNRSLSNQQLNTVTMSPVRVCNSAKSLLAAAFVIGRCQVGRAQGLF
jgi:hypothetical protein